MSATVAGRQGIRANRLTLGLVALGLVACMALIYFDFGPPLAFNDDWGMSWGARQLIGAHRLRVFPSQSALALLQSLWAWLFTLGHPDQRLLRLSVAPLALLACWSSYLWAKRVGADWRWALIAGVLPLGTPVFMGGATSFMTDVPYVALLLTAGAMAQAWVQDGRWRWLCVGMVVIAPLERQIGASLPAAITAALLLSRLKTLGRRDAAALAVMWVGTALSVVMPVLARVAPATEVNRVAAFGALTLKHQLQVLFFLPGTVGLFLLPFAVALGLSVPRRSRHRALFRPGPLLASLVGAFAIMFVFFHGAMGYTYLPGNLWQADALNPVLVFSRNSYISKPLVYPQWLFASFSAGAAITGVLLLVGHRHRWSLPQLGPRQVVPVLIALSQLLPLFLLQTRVFDRYYLAVALPLVPLLATWASEVRLQAPALAFAVFAIAAGVAMYIAGQQDYEAAQAARDQAAQMMYRLAPPDAVNAGYEANATYVEIPLYDHSGALAGGLARSQFDPDFAASGPVHPRYHLEMRPQSDPLPGVNYSSVASARIVIVPGESSPPSP